MKRVLWIALLLMNSMMLTACSGRATPLEDIDIALYDVLYDGDTYVLFVLEDIPEWQNSLCISLEDLDCETCCLDCTTPNCHIVRYDDAYYSLGDGVRLGLFDTYDLMEQGVPFACHGDEPS
ncbi:MAG: hypothetical protein A2Y16_04385 [Tenericutes bacterium GWF2_57_13]|nr:MAG: hypothetical protein A2Y16_04385 [Tenericutes bacterium GWF2_57_13]